MPKNPRPNPKNASSGTEILSIKKDQKYKKICSLLKTQILQKKQKNLLGSENRGRTAKNNSKDKNKKK